MIINKSQKEQLIKNAGEKAENLEANALVRLYDNSGWQCYLIALEPDEDTVLCLLKPAKSIPAQITEWSLSSIESLFNDEGESVKCDFNFRPRQVRVILDELEGRNEH